MLLEKIRVAFEGRGLVAPAMAAYLIERAISLYERLDGLDIAPDNYESLTSRKKEILPMIANGLMDSEIAAVLTIEPGTVKISEGKC